MTMSSSKSAETTVVAHKHLATVSCEEEQRQQELRRNGIVTRDFAYTQASGITAESAERDIEAKRTGQTEVEAEEVEFTETMILPQVSPYVRLTHLSLF